MGGRVSGQWMGGDGHQVYCFRMGQWHPSVSLRMRLFEGDGRVITSHSGHHSLGNWAKSIQPIIANRHRAWVVHLRQLDIQGCFVLGAEVGLAVCIDVVGGKR